MFENDQTPVYCTIVPGTTKKKEKVKIIGNREVAILEKNRIKSLFNLMYYLNQARKKKTSLINYLKSMK